MPTFSSMQNVDSLKKTDDQTEQQQNQNKGSHFLGSGKDFRFGSDRPHSRGASDNDSAGSYPKVSGSHLTFVGDISKKAEFGQIRNEASGKSGPSKRSDRQYKPF